MNKTFRVLQTADWHVCSEFIEDAIRCLDFMLRHVDKMAGAGGLDLIVIPGDIYNSRQIRQESPAARLAFNTVRKLSNFAPVIIITGTPSHDGNAPLILDGIGDRFPVLVVDKPSQWVLYRGDGYDTNFRPIEDQSPALPRVVISCTPAFTKQFFESGSDIATSDAQIATALGAIYAHMGAGYQMFQEQTGNDNLLPHILLGHYSIGGAYIHPSQPMIGKDIEISLEQLGLAQTTINCMGHIHAAQKVGTNTYYCGSLFATDFGEFETKGFYVHELESADQAWTVKSSELVETPSPTLVKIEIDLIRNPVEQSILTNIILATLADVPEQNPASCIVRMEIKTYQDEAKFIDEQVICEKFESLGVRSFKLTINRMPRPNVRSARILAVDRLREKLITRAEIIGQKAPAAALDRADLLQDHEPDELLDMISKSIGKENTVNETAKN